MSLKWNYQSITAISLGQDFENKEFTSKAEWIRYASHRLDRGFDGVYVYFFDTDIEESDRLAMRITREWVDIPFAMSEDIMIDEEGMNVYEFETYEDAFKYCLDLCETSSKCYDPQIER